MTRQDFDKLSYEVLPPKTTHKKCLPALKVFFEKENHPYSSYPASSASGWVTAAGSFRKMPRGNLWPRGSMLRARHTCPVLHKSPATGTPFPTGLALYQCYCG